MRLAGGAAADEDRCRRARALQGTAEQGEPHGNQHERDEERDPHRSANRIITWIRTATGLPSFVPGLNSHCFIALTALSSRP